MTAAPPRADIPTDVPRARRRSLFGDSIRVRLTLWHTLAVAALLTAFSIATWIFLVRTTGTRADQSLDDMARAFVKVWGGVRAEEETSAAASAVVAASEFRDRDRRIVVFNSSGRVIAMSDTTPLTPALSGQRLSNLQSGALAALVQNATPRNQVFATLDDGGNGGAPVRAHAIRVSDEGQSFTVLALRSLRAEEDASESFVTAVMVAIPIALLLAGIGGYLLARASLAPVVAMGRQARRISASNLDERLLVKNPRDELGGLAEVLNGLLGRLEQAFEHEQRSAEQQRQFMADASHELRTPVAALSTVADVALARNDRDATELREALDVVRGEGSRLGRLVDDLLLLSHADAGELPARREQLYLEELLQDSTRAARGLATTRGVSLIAPPAEEAPFVGDGHMLRRLLMILLDNAIKYTPRGGEVRLSLDRDTAAKRYRITVEDTGPGVPTWAAERIFERFFRVDESRGRAAEDNIGIPSAGLGLAIARLAAEAHGGTVHLDATGAEGSRFVVTLPMPSPVRR
jgi:signal transduction histidine kinase